MNIQLIIDLDVETNASDSSSKPTGIINDAYVLKYALEATVPDHLGNIGAQALLDAFKSVSLIVRD